MNNIALFGTKYGGFYYPADLPDLNAESIIYSAGAGEDISHDVCLASRLNAKVHIFDPTPAAIAHVQLVKDVLDNKKKPEYNERYGGGAANYWDIIIKNKMPAKDIIFQPVALGIKDRTEKFYTPDENHTSCSLIKGMVASDNYIEVPVRCLKTLMAKNCHAKIDLLKIDIEGLECSVIDNMLAKNILPLYLSVDFDLGWNGKSIKDKKRCEQVTRSLVQAGYAIIATEWSDFSFILRPHQLTRSFAKKVIVRLNTWYRNKILLFCVYNPSGKWVSLIYHYIKNHTLTEIISKIQETISGILFRKKIPGVERALPKT